MLVALGLITPLIAGMVTNEETGAVVIAGKTIIVIAMTVVPMGSAQARVLILTDILIRIIRQIIRVIITPQIAHVVPVQPPPGTAQGPTRREPDRTEEGVGIIIRTSGKLMDIKIRINYTSV